MLRYEAKKVYYGIDVSRVSPERDTFVYGTGSLGMKSVTREVQ